MLDVLPEHTFGCSADGCWRYLESTRECGGPEFSGSSNDQVPDLNHVIHAELRVHPVVAVEHISRVVLVLLMRERFKVAQAVVRSVSVEVVDLALVADLADECFDDKPMNKSLYGRSLDERERYNLVTVVVQMRSDDSPGLVPLALELRTQASEVGDGVPTVRLLNAAPFFNHAYQYGQRHLEEQAA